MTMMTHSALHNRRRRTGRAGGGGGGAVRIAMLALLLVAAALTSGLLLLPNPAHTPAAHAQTLSTDATLSALTAAAPVSFSPTFAAATTSYTAAVPNQATVAYVTATKTDANASVAVLKGTTAISASGTDVSGEAVAVNLDVGANAIIIRVTAQDNSTQDYTLTVHRTRPTQKPPAIRTKFRASPFGGGDGNNDLRLGHTFLDGNTPSPTLNFTQDTTNNSWADLSAYVCKKDFARDVTVSNGATTYSFHITAAQTDTDCASAVALTGSAGAGTASVSLTAELIANGGAVVQVQHATTHAIYFAQWLPVRFYQDAYIYGLHIDPATLREDFAPATTTYTAVMPVGGPYVTLAAALPDADARIAIHDTGTSAVISDASPEPGIQLAVAGDGGNNAASSAFSITVTAANSTANRTYNLTLHRARQPNSTTGELFRHEDYDDTSTGSNYDLQLTTTVLDGHEAGAQTLEFTQDSATNNSWTDLSLYVCQANRAVNSGNAAIGNAATASNCSTAGTVTGTDASGSGSVTLTAANAAHANAVIQIQHTTANTVYFSQLVDIRFVDDAAVTGIGLSNPAITTFFEGNFLPTHGALVEAVVTILDGPAGAQPRTVTYRSAGSLTQAVAAGIDAITVSPATSHPDATWELLDTNNEAIPGRTSPGSTDHRVALDVGANTIKIRVTAPDGVTRTTYVLTLWRVKPAVAPADTLHRTSTYDSTGTDMSVGRTFLPSETSGDVLALTQTGASPSWTNLSLYICRLDTVGGATDRADTDDNCRLSDNDLSGGSASLALTAAEIGEGSLVLKVQNTSTNVVGLAEWLPIRFGHDHTLRSLDVTGGALLTGLAGNPLGRGFDLKPASGMTEITVSPVSVNSLYPPDTFSPADSNSGLDGHQVDVSSLPVMLTFEVDPQDRAATTYTINIADLTDYDPDDNNLIDLNLTGETGAAGNTAGVGRLNAIRYDLDGDGAADDSANDATYNAAFANRGTYGIGCPQGCRGYELKANLDLSGHNNWQPIGGEVDNVIMPYDADFVGNGYAIDNLQINRGGQNGQTGVGLFRALAKNRRISGVAVTNADVTGRWYTGALVGINDGTVAASYSTGAVSGHTATGALVGFNSGIAEVLASYSDADAAGTATPEINRLPPTCEADPDRPGVRCEEGPRVRTAPSAGSLVGFNEGTIKASWASGQVDKSMGLTGSNAGTIENSYWDRQVSGASDGNTLAGLDADIAALEAANPSAIDPDTTVNPFGQTNQQRATALRAFRAAILRGFGAGHQTTAALMTPTGAAGIYAGWDNLDIDGDGVADEDPWDYGNAYNYPRLSWMMFDPDAERNDYDSDDNDRIAVTTLAQLDAIRQDLNGDGLSPTSAAAYYAAFPDPAGGMGCPGGSCAGYELRADLDFDTDDSGTVDDDDDYPNWSPIGAGTGTAAYTSNFDGNGHTISNLKINSTASRVGGGITGTRYVGLFGVLASTGTIEDVGVLDVDVDSALTSNGNDAYDVGGLLGRLNGGTVRGSYATGAIDATASSTHSTRGALIYTGGLVGQISAGGTVAASWADVAVTATSSSPTNTQGWLDRAGGLVGRSFTAADSVTASYATGAVTANRGSAQVGGLMGWMNGGSITASYATGAVTATGTGALATAGGLIAALGSSGGTITDSYWDTETSGIPDSDPAASHGEGKTSAELKAPTEYGSAIYADWDVNVDEQAGDDDPWEFGADRHYPILKYGIHADTTNLQRPVDANAGSDQTVTVGDPVTLDGSGSRAPGGGSPTYAWQYIQATGGPAVTLSSATVARPSFVAPTVTANTTLEFELTVTAGGKMATDRVSVTVSLAPVTPGGGTGGSGGSGGTPTPGQPGSRDGLSSLTVTTGSGAAAAQRPLTPAFASGTLSYDTYVGAYTTAATIGMTPADGASTVSFNGDVPATPGAREVRVSLAEGHNRFTIVVTPLAAPDQSGQVVELPEPTTYRLNIRRQRAPRLAFEPPRVLMNEGESASYEVALDTRWLGAEVVITISSNNPDVTVSPTRVSIDQYNWSARTITVTAAADADTEDDFATIRHVANGGQFDNVGGRVWVEVTDAGAAQTPTPTPAPTPAPGETPTPTPEPTPTPAPEPTPTPTPTPTPEPTPSLPTLPITFTTEVIQNGHTVTTTREAGSLLGVTVTAPAGLDRSPRITISPAPGPHPQVRPPLRLGAPGTNAIAGVRVLNEPTGGMEVCLPVPAELLAEAGGSPLTLARYDGAGGDGWRAVPGSRRPGSGGGTGTGAGTGGGAAAAGGADSVCAAGVSGLAGGSVFAVAYTVMPLGPASDLTVTPGDGAGTLTLRWTPGANATRHWIAGIKQSDWDAEDYSNIIWTAASGNDTHAVSGLDSGAVYVFGVAAGRGSEWSAWSSLERGTPD